MATSAYTPGDAANYSQEDFSAAEVMKENDNEGTVEAERKAQAEDAGVADARFIGYAEVLDVYQRRSDTEHLADRRARAIATDPAQQDFARAADYDGVSGTESDSGFGDPVEPEAPGGEG